MVISYMAYYTKVGLLCRRKLHAIAEMTARELLKIDFQNEKEELFTYETGDSCCLPLSRNMVRAL